MIIAAAAALALAAMGAAYLPARRAASIDLLQALREDEAGRTQAGMPVLRLQSGRAAGGIVLRAFSALLSIGKTCVLTGISARRGRNRAHPGVCCWRAADHALP